MSFPFAAYLCMSLYSAGFFMAAALEDESLAKGQTPWTQFGYFLSSLLLGALWPLVLLVVGIEEVEERRRR